MRPRFVRLPDFYRRNHISTVFWHTPPPLFPRGKPSARDLEHAREAFLLLDRTTQIWYASNGQALFGDLVESLPDPRTYYAPSDA